MFMREATSLSLLAHILDGVCPGYDSSPWYAGLIVAIDFYQYYLTIGFFAATLLHPDFYLKLMSTFLTLDWLVNIGLRYAVGQTPPHPPCGGEFEMPSFASQHVGSFVCLILSAALLWRARLRGLHVAYMGAFVVAPVYARLYIGANSRMQLVAGAAVGTGFALVAQALIYTKLYPAYRAAVAGRVPLLGSMENAYYRDGYASLAAVASGVHVDARGQLVNCQPDCEPNDSDWTLIPYTELHVSAW